MVLFGLETNKEEKLTKFVRDTNERINDNNMVKNPFTGKVTTKNLPDNRMLHIVEISPIYMNFTIFGWLLCFIFFFLRGFTWWLAPGIVLGCLGIFWTAPFFRMMYKKGMRKAGYLNDVKSIKHKEIILMLCNMEAKEDGTIGCIRTTPRVEKKKQ